MTIHSFLKVEKGDPDWQYSPEQYFGREFKLITGSTVELAKKHSNVMVLRQNPTEKDLVAKNIKIEIKEDAKLDLIILNELDSNLQQIFLYDIHVHENAVLNLGIFAKNGKFNKHIFQVHLEEFSEFNNYGLIYNDTEGDTEIITKIIHTGNDSSSNQLILGLAGANSQTVYQGMAILTNEAEGSQAGIESNNLIFDKAGKCFSKPEIVNNCENTKINSGTSTEFLQGDKIYYLESKGLDFNKARETILSSFQNRVLDIIPYEDVKEEAKQLFSK